MAKGSDDPALGSRSRVLFAALGSVVLVGAAVVPLTVATPSHSGARYYTASFGRAGQGLDPGKSDVKVRGVTVGTVDSVKLASNGQVTVRIRIDDRSVGVPRTASAAVEPVSVFGPKDLSLDLGSGAGPYLADGGTIAKTADPRELSETALPAYRLASLVDPRDLATLTHTFAQGLSGQGPALRRGIDNGGRLVEAAHARRAQIRRLLDDVAGVSGTLAERGDALTGAAGDLNALSPAVGGRPDKLGELLDGASRMADTVGGQLERSGDKVGTVIDGTGRTAAVINQGRQSLPGLADALNALFSGLGSAINQPGPEGSRLVSAGYLVPLDLCYNLIDVCGDRSPMHPKKPAS